MTNALMPRTPGDPQRFGTEAFYSAVGRAFIAMCVFVPVLWAIELLDYATHQGLDRIGGIRPRHLDGLDGVIFAPFLHFGFTHLAANSVPLLLLGTFVLAGQPRRFCYITAFVVAVSGLGVWIVGDPRTVVVGASAVIFGYLGYLLVRGLVERSWWHLGVGLLVGLLYGWQVAAVLPTARPISWQGHLFGFVAGAVAAILFRRRGRRLARVAPSPTLTQPTVHLPDA